MSTQNNVIIKKIDECKLNNLSNNLNDLSNNFNDFKVNGSIDNLTTNKINNSKKLYEDKYTFLNGYGPYQIDAIPILIKDKFKMPKYSVNRSNDNSLTTTETYDTRAFPEMVIYVPSKRKNVITTPVFKQQNINENDNLGSYNVALEDYMINNYRSSNPPGNLGYTLNKKVSDFVTACKDNATTDISRNVLLNAILNDNDYKFIKNNVKVPFKVWDQVVQNGEFVYDNLLDENNVPLINRLNNDISYNTLVSRSSWPLDNNGNPTELLPITSNINASGVTDLITGLHKPLDADNKMGLFIFNLGNGMSQQHQSACTLVPGLIASLGYVVIVNISNPINGGLLSTKSKKTICKLLADKVTNLDLNSLDNEYYMSTNAAYTNELGTIDLSCNRANFRNSSLSQYGRLIYERMMYQELCVLRKLGLYNKINWNNVVLSGLSGGGYGMNVIHDLLNVNVANSSDAGKAKVFTLNDISGNPTVKPFLVKIKAMIGWQSIHVDLSNLTNDQKISVNYPDDKGRNNRYNLGINVLKCPLIYITGDGDAYDNNLKYQDLFNSGAQVIFQLTKKATDSVTDMIFANCMVLYKPTNSHLQNIDNNNGELTQAYAGSFTQSWLTGGFEIPQYAQWPSISNVIDSGLKSQLAYTQYEDLKTMIALQLSAHRFLGVNFPVPTNAFAELGWRTDMMPTHCDILTEAQYTRYGPLSYISYDNKYNLSIESTEIITNSKALILKSEDGSKTYKLTINNSGVITTTQI